MDYWKNKGVNERTSERTTERLDQQTHERMNEAKEEARVALSYRLERLLFFIRDKQPPTCIDNSIVHVERFTAVYHLLHKVATINFSINVYLDFTVFPDVNPIKIICRVTHCKTCHPLISIMSPLDGHASYNKVASQMNLQR